MAKKNNNPQDLIFGLKGRISFVDPFPHRGKDTINLIDFLRKLELKRKKL